MRLTALGGEESRLSGAGDVEVTGLTADSREVRPGFLFAALAGSRTDGRRFVDDALARGAVAVLGDRSLAGRDLGVPVLASEQPRRAFALAAARFHERQPAFVAAVTGTNGKTSIAGFARQLWERLGQPAGSVGTLGVISPAGERPLPLTTPDPASLHAILRELAEAGVDHAVIEASSHALDQHRVDGVRLGAAAFSNITRDHFDYHGSFEAYLAAKTRLFGELLPAGATAVLNADVPEYAGLADLARTRGVTVLDYGRNARSLRLLGQEMSPLGQRLELELLGHRATVESALVGSFQAHNLLAAAGLVIAGGAAPQALLPHLGAVAGARGRMELAVRLASGAAAFVDYAHTPDALEQALRALRAHSRGKIVVIFGCGGDRDAGKRPIMGAIAARLADRVIVTDDNPRSEDPAAIRAAIMAACPGATEIGDRAEAIRAGLAGLAPGDLLLVAGKGHESGQTVAGVTHPFDDREVVQRLAAGLGSAP
ncbi:UDP-N-acetylmuramoyl-L-alanyl-D-glutamate--2,6-diaminopimelate ligase [Marinimicrococcus flavescens]|uniref:UDP-N-acetylmuramoyl-L-alanyl-D-glutamate--2,6-diaminopimelate ligase n=1 Tax=Marinimicrococcus flavescens TaxID=3031815 RepID=A0AAP4D6S3_9PROT|nr:UDP-N-acetylmuramoyl-L-alanyl-D-glutamate--2,6-diaminopimelate ligase [Marinimicrococcus flavescens]